MASEKTTQILDLIKALTILELSDLVKAKEHIGTASLGSSNLDDGG